MSFENPANFNQCINSLHLQLYLDHIFVQKYLTKYFEFFRCAYRKNEIDVDSYRILPLIVCRFFVFSNLYLLKGFSIYFAYNDEVERETAQYNYYFMTSFIYFKFDNLYRQP